MYKIQNNKERIVNNYYLRAELTTRVLVLIFCMFLLYNSVSHLMIDNDTIKLFRYKVGVVLSLIGFFSVTIYQYKLLKILATVPLKIIIDDEKIEYEYVTFSGEICTYIMKKDDIKIIEWSFIPILGEVSKVRLKFDTINDKLESSVAIVLSVVFNILFVFTFYAISFFKIRKYYIIDDGHVVLSVPYELEESFLKREKLRFSTLTLRSSLIIKTSSMFKNTHCE
jgi:hypothetical protein